MIENNVQLSELFRFKGVEEQLEEGINALESSWAEYRRDISGVTKRLEDAGYVALPDYSGKGLTKKLEWGIETIVNSDLAEPGYSTILTEDSGMIITGSKRRLANADALVKLPRSFAGKSVNELASEALRKFKLGNLCVGFDFEGVQYADKRFRRVFLVDIIRGSIANELLPDSEFRVNIYNFSEKKPPERGAVFCADYVPSFSGERPYSITIEHVPVYQGLPTRQEKKLSFDIACKHTCPKTMYDFRAARGSRKSDELLLDFHVILAMKKGKKAFEKKYPGWHVLDPFVEPSEGTKQFFWNCLYRTLVEERDESGHVRRKPLDWITTEVYLWDLVGYRTLRINNK